MSASEVSPVASPAAQAQDAQKPWWRHPMVWLVISGPLSVVIASVISAVVAVRGADPVLLRDESGGASEVHDGVDSMTPALAARNHAATPKQEP